MPVPSSDDDASAFPSDSVVVHTLSFLPWDFSVQGMATLPGWALLYALLPVCRFAEDLPTQQRLAATPVPYLSLAPPT
eukprot:5818945-Pleurochrysis_carterae.AAC.1